MRQRRWLELMANFDIDLQYHPGKANVVPDALSRKSDDYMAVQITQQKELIKEMAKLDLMVIWKSNVAEQMMTLQLRPNLIEKIKT